jgi:hypothetical protein
MPRAILSRIPQAPKDHAMPLLSRRRFLAVTGTALAGTAASADITCAPFDFSGVRRCTVGLRNVPVVMQNCQYWCWAASAELAFRVQGYDVPQTEFVRRAYGNPDTCKTATGPMMKQAISGAWTDRAGRSFTASFDVLLDYDHGVQNTPDPMQVVRDELEANRLVIAGTLGHAICITAMDYAENQMGQRQLQSLTVRDPWPSSGNRYVMSPQQFFGGRLLAAIRFS